MSVIDELSPYIRAYPKVFRMARARCGLTNEELSDRSGVPYSTVRNAQSGNGGVTIVQAAALARVLDLSIDEMFGAVKPEAERQRAELEQRIRTLELELADRNGEIRSLRDSNDALRSELTRRTYSLITVCSLMFFAVVWYLIWDFRLPKCGTYHRRQHIARRVVYSASGHRGRLRHGPLSASYVFPVYEAIPHRFHRSRAGR